ncbi:glycosyl transferase [secondary endosymbiont of Heteropsylla cubana]|uniref:Glycosyl transferase n=1 Tax=secondary endosymbiont of Heteropsylla cubana TaxID=134287 RepID=J3TYM2_9ENTR|nr:glycosyltransferase family 2 protein [secondary endosymbiont of Heteropsylla cubana]AFP85505.1 glycosyl transferase [secondary endosymbiont of Heteropsylla cubana]
MFHKNLLSVIIITKNEAELLPACLLSVNWVDEIIVLDNGSTDQTRNIAIKAGARVFHTDEWIGFGVQRQLAQTYASSDYILMLDADERVTPSLREAIQNVLKNPKSNTVYSCTRRNLFLDRFMRYGSWYPDRVVRLYEREHYGYNALPVHESLTIGHADVVSLGGDLEHLTCRDLITFQRKQLWYAEIWAKSSFKKTNKYGIIKIIIHTISSFLRSWLLRAGFLDGKHGWILAMINAQYTFNKYTTLWALNKQNKL